MNKNFSILLFMLCFMDCIGQIDGKDSNANMRDMSSGNMFRSFDNRFKGIEGYPTLKKHYHKGEIVLTSGLKFIYDSVNLDIYNNDLLVKKNNIETIVNKSLVAGFSIELPDGIKYFTKLRDNEGKTCFYEVLVKGRFKLFKRTLKVISSPTKHGPYDNGRLYSVFEEKMKLYLQEDEGEIIELKSRKQLLEKLPNQFDLLSKFMKENRTVIKNEDSCRIVIELMNTL